MISQGFGEGHRKPGSRCTDKHQPTFGFKVLGSNGHVHTNKLFFFFFKCAVRLFIKKKKKPHPKRDPFTTIKSLLLISLRAVIHLKRQSERKEVVAEVLVIVTRETGHLLTFIQEICRQTTCQAFKMLLGLHAKQFQQLRHLKVGYLIKLRPFLYHY